LLKKQAKQTDKIKMACSVYGSRKTFPLDVLTMRIVTFYALLRFYVPRVQIC